MFPSRLAVLSPSQIWQFPVSECSVLARPDFPGLYILNRTATRAWRLLTAGKSFDAGVRDFVQHYGIPKARALGDLQRTWDHWEQTVLASSTEDVGTPVEVPVSNTRGGFVADYALEGKSVRIMVDDPGLELDIAPRVAPLLVESVAQPDITLSACFSETGYHVFVNSTWIGTEHEPNAARLLLLQEFVRSVRNSDWIAILHAAACGLKNRCILFPAASQSGKTTLSVALMRAGLDFYTDDSAPIERGAFTVSAMPFSLMVRQGSWPAVTDYFPGFRNLPVYSRYGQDVKFFSPPVRHRCETPDVASIVFSRWQPDAATSLTPLDSFEGLLRLKDSGFWIAHDRASIQSFLDWLQRLPIYELIYSDVVEAVVIAQRLLVE